MNVMRKYTEIVEQLTRSARPLLAIGNALMTNLNFGSNTSHTGNGLAGYICPVGTKQDDYMQNQDDVTKM